MKSAARWAWLLLGLLLTACGTTSSAVAARCPNWKEAMHRAEAIAGCDAHHRGDPNNRCQAALKRCKGGCDICQFLGDRNQLELNSYVADEDEWPAVRRVSMNRRYINGYEGTRAKSEPGVVSRQYKFNWHLCHEPAFVDVLASTIDHESMHGCAAVNFPGIFDKGLSPPQGCSAEELENTCVGK